MWYNECKKRGMIMDDEKFDEGVMYHLLNKQYEKKLNKQKSKSKPEYFDGMDDLEFDEMNDIWDEMDEE